MLKKTITTCVVSLFCLSLTSIATGADHKKLFYFLSQKFPEQYKVVGHVSEKFGDRLVFPADKADLEKGQELIVLSQKKDTPFYLSPKNSVLQISSRVQGKYLADILARLDKEGPSIRDPVVLPSSPTIYVYSNIENRDGLAPYQRLLQSLIKNNYEVVELYKSGLKKARDKYGVLLRLEGSDNTLITKLQSVYSGATLYSEARKYEQDFQLAAPAGKDILPEQATQIQTAEVPETRHAEKAERPEKGREKERFARVQEQEKSFKEVQESKARQISRLSNKYQRLIVCQLDESEEEEIVLLNNNKIQVFHRRSDRLQPVYGHNFSRDDMIGLHLHAMDLNGDGLDELAVTLGKEVMVMEAKTTRLRSQILTVKDGRFRPLARRLPYYLRAIQDSSGEEVLLGQKKGKYDPYTGDIYRIKIGQDQELSTEPYTPAANIYSVYQFNLAPGYPDKIMILQPSNHISVYHAPKEKEVGVTDVNYGGFHIVPYPIRLEGLQFKGGFEKKTTYQEYFVPRRFCLKTGYHDKMFTINKQRKTQWNINRIMDMVTDKNTKDSLVALKWTGEYIRQTWESKKLSKDILDFAFMSDQDKDKIFLLVKDMQGFALQRIE